MCGMSSERIGREELAKSRGAAPTVSAATIDPATDGVSAAVRGQPRQLAQTGGQFSLPSSSGQKSKQGRRNDMARTSARASLELLVRIRIAAMLAQRHGSDSCAAVRSVQTPKAGLRKVPPSLVDLPQCSIGR